MASRKGRPTHAATASIGHVVGRRLLFIIIFVVIVPLSAIALWATRGAKHSGRALLRSQLSVQLDAMARDVEHAWGKQRADLLSLGENEPMRAFLAADSSAVNAAPAYVERLFSTMDAFDRVVVRDRAGRVRLTFGNAFVKPDADQRSSAAKSSATSSATSAATSAPGVSIQLPLMDLTTGQPMGTLVATIGLSALVPAAVRSPTAAGPLITVAPAGGGVLPLLGVDPRVFESEATTWSGDRWTTVRRAVAEPPMELVIAGAMSAYETPFAQTSSRITIALSITFVLVVTIAVFVTRQVTRHVEREFATREALAVVGEFASELAHEVRNPLTAIRLDIQRAEECADDAVTVRAVLPRVLGQIDRMDRAVSGALRITRAGSIAPRAVDFARVLESAYRSAEPECVRRAARVSLDVDHLPGLTLRGDEIALEQLCLNLLINAAQSLRGGGDIAVKARNLGATIELSITDSGVGMTTAQLAELEQPYRSTRRDGTGLGLKIARRIVLNHHGELTFESAPGAGTTVRVRLPT